MASIHSDTSDCCCGFPSGENVDNCERCVLIATVRLYKQALIQIRDSIYCDYSQTGGGSYGTGVTDGHRYCAQIVRDVAGLDGDKW